MRTLRRHFPAALLVLAACRGEPPPLPQAPPPEATAEPACVEARSPDGALRICGMTAVPGARGSSDFVGEVGNPGDEPLEPGRIVVRVVDGQGVELGRDSCRGLYGVRIEPGAHVPCVASVRHGDRFERFEVVAEPPRAPRRFAAKLEVSETEVVRAGPELLVRGRIRNAADSRVRKVRALAVVRDAAGTIVGGVQAYPIASELAAGEATLFQVRLQALGGEPATASAVAVGDRPAEAAEQPRLDAADVYAFQRGSDAPRATLVVRNTGTTAARGGLEVVFFDGNGTAVARGSCWLPEAHRFALAGGSELPCGLHLEAAGDLSSWRRVVVYGEPAQRTEQLTLVPADAATETLPDGQRVRVTVQNPHGEVDAAFALITLRDTSGRIVAVEQTRIGHLDAGASTTITQRIAAVDPASQVEVQAYAFPPSAR
jgi:hypothetical protein